MTTQETIRIEDKVRRRLAPFVVEGKIETPKFAYSPREKLAVSVKLHSAAPRREVETALERAMADMTQDAYLVIDAA
ncbi:MAG: hypothetical protein KGL46_09600 [Hyphomicrobiales bacterium]|nr:hypothetical protein [Hyphomicrobiales bacterium]